MIIYLICVNIMLYLISKGQLKIKKKKSFILNNLVLMFSLRQIANKTWVIKTKLIYDFLYSLKISVSN